MSARHVVVPRPQTPILLNLGWPTLGLFPPPNNHGPDPTPFTSANPSCPMMDPLRPLAVLVIIVLATPLWAQQIVDSCFTSQTPSTGFNHSPDLRNLGSIQADLMEWTGSGWIGAWPNANLTLGPPSGQLGCRAMFIGDAVAWTTGGEGFAMRLDTPLVAGHTYTYHFTYVSHGMGSNGAFSPRVYTNSTAALGYWLGNLTPVGYVWTTHSFTFTADTEQDGHNWLMITTHPDQSSGMVSAPCQNCSGGGLPDCSVHLGSDTLLCTGDELLLEAGVVADTYLWQDGSTGPTFSVDGAGTYWVQVTEGECISTDTIEVGFIAPPEPDLGGDLHLCEGDTLALDVFTPNGGYIWSDGSTAPTHVVTEPGPYWVTVTVGPCTGTDTIEVHFDLPPNLDLGPDTALCRESPLALDATTTGVSSYLWHDGSTTPARTVFGPGTYWVMASAGTCSLTDTVFVEALDCDLAVDMPNVFTPNGDGWNDTFRPISVIDTGQAMLTIRNRWGQRLFETDDLLRGRDGRVHGHDSPDGTYFWVLQYATSDGSPRHQSGFVTLIR